LSSPYEKEDKQIKARIVVSVRLNIIYCAKLLK
jgi:hypothetical protein